MDSALSRPSRAFCASLRRVSSPEAGAYSSATAAPTAAPTANATRMDAEFPLSAITSTFLEDAYADSQKFLGILADVCKQVSEFYNCPIHIVIKLLVAKQLSRRAFTAVQAPDDVIDAAGHLIEPVVQLFVGEQLAHRALALVEPVRR